MLEFATKVTADVTVAICILEFSARLFQCATRHKMKNKKLSYRWQTARRV